jgi:hypothetical protein
VRLQGLGHSKTAITSLANAVFSDVTPCGSCKNQRLGRTGFRGSLFRLLVTVNVVSSSPILVTLKMEKIISYETSVLTRATPCNIPENGLLHSYRRENLKSYIALTGWAL